jgi:hypothetical protein
MSSSDADGSAGPRCTYEKEMSSLLQVLLLVLLLLLVLYSFTAAFTSALLTMW